MKTWIWILIIIAVIIVAFFWGRNTECKVCNKKDDSAATAKPPVSGIDNNNKPQ